MDIQLVSIFSTTVSVLKDRGTFSPNRSKQELGPTRGPLLHLPAQHELWVLGNILLDQVLQESLHHLGEILQFVVQRHGEQTGHVTSVSLREPLLGLQGVDELQDAHGTHGHQQV